MKHKNFLLVFLLSYAISWGKEIANTPVADEEYRALIDFYNSVNGDNWSNKWDININDIHLGNWYGIVSENGHITEINLRNNKVRGAIPASFSNLKYLKKLDLHGPQSNDLSTTDLNNLSGLESLEYLDLSYCKLSGNIPASWAQLTKLKTLLLNNNKLEGPLFNEIGELTALESIKIGTNQLTAIPETIGNLMNLKTFNAYNNKISGSLLKAFEGLAALTRLQIHSNELSDIDALLNSSVSLSIDSQRIALDNFTYQGEDVVLASLPRITQYDRNKNDFSYLPTFRFYLRGINQGDLTMAANGSLTVPKGYLASIKEGDDIYLQQISGGASNSSTIRFNTIAIDLPAVPDEEYQALVDFYNAMNGLNWSNQWPIDTNNLNQGAWHGIAIENGHITEINLRNSNRVRGAIPASFSNLKYLKKLDLHGSQSNDLSTTDLNNVSGLESLEYLDLSYCQLVGSIPSSWSTLTKLKTLLLNNNKLEGPLFNGIGELTALESIKIGTNQLTAIPETIGNLINLKTFNIHNNKISGSLLKAFEGLTALSRLEIGSNELSDIDALLNSSVSLNISSQRIALDNFTYQGEDVVFTSLPRITQYDRNKNDFSYLPTFRFYLRGRNQGNLTMAADGSLTVPKGHLTSAKKGDDIYLQQINRGASNSSTIRFNTIAIDLPPVPDEEYQSLVDFYNAMNGLNWSNQWPIDTNNLNQGAWHGIAIENGHITEINLRNSNRVRGAIPASFSNLQYLKKLDLHGSQSNDLSTTDLNNVSGLESLEYLDLSYCQLVGSIPSSWSTLTKLKTLLLNNNKLEGPLFNGIGELTALESIKIGTNQLTAIPETIGNLINLKTFNVNNNKISGSLLKAFEGLTALSRLEIGSNELSDIDALLNSSVSLNISSQRIALDNFTYQGEDVVFTSLPRITQYDRNKNDFSYLPTFRFYLRGRNQGNLTMAADGSLTVPKGYLTSAKKGDDIYLQQINRGASNSSTIRFNTIAIDLPPVPDEEYQSLVDFYNAMNGLNWSNQWPIDTNNLNQGAWHGIAIENGHITEINLRNSNRVRGAIPASFSNLKYLKKLDLHGSQSNDLSTTDLNNLSGLESLEYLDLSYCKLAGNIPASWAQLTQLKTLRINNNTIEGIDTSFNSLKPVSLNFEYQDLTFDSVELGADKIFIDLPRYMTIKLTDGNITFDAKNEFRLYINEVPQRTSFSNNGQLIFSNLSQLGIEETDQIRIYQVDGIARRSNLNYNAVSFGPPLVDEEFEILKKIYNSTDGANWTSTWDISMNNVNQVSWFGVSIQNGHVIGLDLFNNQLSGTIPEEITGLTFLKTLNLSNNDLEGTLPGDLHLLSDLEILDVNSNTLSGLITSKISDLKKLKKLAIGDNEFNGAIPTAFSDFVALEHLDISSNGFDKIDKKLYYDFLVTYIDLRNQKINNNTILSLAGNQLEVTLSDIVKYDLENNNFEAKNNFSLLVNNLTHDTTTLNDSGDIIFQNVRINEIPIDATIAVRQTTGSFLNTEFSFAGIEDRSNVPVVEEEYLTLVDLYTQLNGSTWTNTWDTSSNSLHSDKWYGVTTYDGHIVGIDLSANNVSGTISNIFDKLPFLTELDLSSNKITTLEAVLPATIDLSIDRQTNTMGSLDLSLTTTINDNTINRYDHEQQGFLNQTYYVTIGSFSRTLNIPEEGVKLMDLMTNWKVPNGQKVILRQNSGDAINSIINYDLIFKDGDANLDNTVNVLDIQTTINHILGDYIQYFNYYGADITGDDAVNILDLIGQVNAIQSGTSVSRIAHEVIKSSYDSDIVAINNNLASLSINNGTLILDPNGHEVTSFEIILEHATEDIVEELVSDIGFNVYIKENQGQLSIVAFSLDTALDTKIALAKMNNEEPKILSGMLANKKAIEIPIEILEQTLGIDDIDRVPISQNKNYPNPFNDKTTFEFFSDQHRQKAFLTIYSITGEKIVEDQMKPIKQGINQYQFKRNDLPSGIYLYTIGLDKTNTSTLLRGKITIK